MYAMPMHGKAITGEERTIRIPNKRELKSRYVSDNISQMIQHGQRGYKISPMYENTPDVMKRKK